MNYQRLKQCIAPFLLLPAILYADGPGQPEILKEPVDISTALELALAKDPRLRVQAERIEAAEGRLEQAGRRPNPVLGAEVENFLGTGPMRDVEGLEVTVGIRQLIETAGKRNRRAKFAEEGRRLAEWDEEQLLAEIEAETRGAFLKVLLAREHVKLREDQLELAEQSLIETERLVEAALAPKVDLIRSRLEVRNRQFALERASRSLAKAKAALAARWGMTPAPEFSVTGNLVIGEKLPAFEALLAVLPDTVQLRRFSVLEQQRQAALDLEEARARPDLELFAGGRYVNESGGDTGFVVGIEVPWPLFDRNRGNIRSARAELRAVEHERQATRRNLETRLTEAWQQLTEAHAEVLSVETDLLPVAEETFSETEAGYEAGQFRQLAVLEARALLFELRETRLDALQRYIDAQAEIVAITRPATLEP